MNTVVNTTQSIWRTMAIDAALIVGACLVPTLSHIFAVPLYQLNPMLLMLVAGMLLVKDRRNAMLLAVLMPVVSMVAVGMPSPLKAVCMVAELLTVVSIASMGVWQRVKMNTRLAGFASLLTAMLCGKVVYYALKALLLSSATLIGTPWGIQLAVAVSAALLYALLKK